MNYRYQEELKTIYVYADTGTSEASVNGWLLTLNAYFLDPATIRIRTTTASTIEHDLQLQPPQQTVLIIPGGADLAYVRDLKGSPSESIRACVLEGGTYIGSCAGAYFASQSCVFEPYNSKLQVLGKRPLSFIPFPAVGAVRNGFQYGSEKGATVETLLCFGADGSEFQAQVYCNGGPAFPNVSSSKKETPLNLVESSVQIFQDYDDHVDHVTEKTTVIARYTEPLLKRHGFSDELMPAAILSRSVGRGVAVVCGVHPEMTPHILSPDNATHKLLRQVFIAARLK